MSKLGIVVVGYNRLENLQRILNRLNDCNYEDDNLLLIVSLDNSGMDSLPVFAKNFKWLHGDKYVKTFPQRLGLRQHILNCGNYLNEFNLDAISVFEDDIYPSNAFYNYMKQSVEFYKNDTEVAGISLYTHLWNMAANAPFNPVYQSNYDTFYLQYAQSWGQIWMRKQWNEFYEWYKNNKEYIDNKRIPQSVSNWKETSWLKYHIKYCIEENKYFVYPYKSLTTCFSDVGEHAIIKSTTYQVPLENSMDKKYNFPMLDGSSIRYDAFFESLNVYEHLNLEAANLVVDLYGAKRSFQSGNYVLTTEVIEEPIIRSYGLELRPIEMNIYCDIPGNEIFLYKISSDQVLRNKKSDLTKWIYNNRTFPNWSTLFKILAFKIKFLTISARRRFKL